MASSTSPATAILALGLSLILTGCAASEPPPAPPPARSSTGIQASLDHWIAAEGPDTSPRAITLAPAAQAPIEILAPAPAPPARPRRGSKVDVNFAGAEMVNAMQFLADAGHFNVVLESGLSGQVSATLHHVDPFDALVVLAEAHGATVVYDREVVMVRRR